MAVTFQNCFLKAFNVLFEGPMLILEKAIGHQGIFSLGKRHRNEDISRGTKAMTRSKGNGCNCPCSLCEVSGLNLLVGTHYKGVLVKQHATPLHASYENL